MVYFLYNFFSFFGGAFHYSFTIKMAVSQTLCKWMYTFYNIFSQKMYVQGSRSYFFIITNIKLYKHKSVVKAVKICDLNTLGNCKFVLIFKGVFSSLKSVRKSSIQRFLFGQNN